MKTFISATNKDFKNKKVPLVLGLRNLPQKFLPSALNKKYRSGQAEQLELLISRAEVGNFEPLYLSNESRF